MKTKPFKHASLFTGIGGFDLAALWMGWENVFQCETDPFCQKVIKHHFPQCELFTDIKTSNFSKYHGTIDIITGGFPCQPFSVAGKRRGTDDDRYLWAEMLRAIREVQPRRVVAENVCGLLTLQSGMVFERVCADMEDAGYEVQTFVIPACAVGAPHRRDRVWMVACSRMAHRTAGNADSRIFGEVGKIFKRKSLKSCGNSKVTPNPDGDDAGRFGHGQTGCANGTNQSSRNVPDNGTAICSGDKRFIAYAESKRQKSFKTGAGIIYTPVETGVYGRGGDECTAAHAESQSAGKLPDKSRTQGTPCGDELFGKQYTVPNWDYFPAQSPVCSRNDGFSDGLADIAFSKWCTGSIKALGNAIVPQVAFQIFKAIEKAEPTHT